MARDRAEQHPPQRAPGTGSYDEQVETLLVPEAIPLASELAKRVNAKIVIAHVDQDTVGKGGGPISATEDEIQRSPTKRARI
jgi:hypothetical protein